MFNTYWNLYMKSKPECSLCVWHNVVVTGNHDWLEKVWPGSGTSLCFGKSP